MQNPFCGSKAEADALNAYLKLVRATEKVTTESHRHLSVVDLTSSQFAVLEALHHLGPLSQREIARKILKSHGNITLVINNLAKRNLVERRPCSSDRRAFSIELTETGAALIKKIFPHHAAGIAKSLSPLTAAEQHELARLCRKLGTG